MRHWIAAAALCATLLFSSCQQKNEHTGPQAVAADAHAAIVIVPDLPIWTMTGGALAGIAETIPIGEKLAVTGGAQKLTSGGTERDYLPVRRDYGLEGWVRSDSVVSRAILAVVTTDDAMVYSAEANSAATSETVPRLTLVAIHSETGGMPFIRVSFYDPSRKAVRRRIALRNEGVSSHPSDVQAAILLQLAASSHSQKQQKAFLTSAMKDYPDSLFTTDLQGALAALTAPPPSPPAPAPAAPPPSPPAPADAPPAAAPGQ